MALQSAPVALIHPDLIKRLRTAFPPRPIVPETKPTAAYYEAGQRSVMDFIERELKSKKTISGDPRDLKE